MDNTIRANVLWLDWMLQDEQDGERLGLGIGSSDPDILKAARKAVNSLPFSYRRYNGFRGEYQLTLDLLDELRELAERWDALKVALGKLEADGSIAVHQERHNAWKQRQTERWERRQRAQQEQAYQTSSANGSAPAVPADVAAAFELLHLKPDAPPGLVGVARRYFLGIWHPDRPHGNVSVAQKFNHASDLAMAWARKTQQRQAQQQ